MKFPADKFHQNFIDLFPSDKKEAREKLKELLAELESIPDAFCGAAWLTSQEFAYISPKVEAILGYPYSNFFEGGVLFFYTTIPSENIESIKHQTEKHFQQLFHPSFKIESHQLFKTNGAARLSNGERINVLQQAVLLDFYAEDKSFFVIGVWGKTSGINEEVLIKRTANTDRVLKNIKTAYMTLYPERFQTNNHILTSREREIILLLSRGYSTKQVSQQLKISFHTVETHRKKLLRKWNALNTAQLIKEVSKFMNW